MKWILWLYSFYFIILAAALVLYATDYQLSGSAVVLSVVSAHFVAGTYQWITTKTTLASRYSISANIAADLLLTSAAVFAGISVADPAKVEWFATCLSLATVGNVFCVVGHMSESPTKSGYRVHKWPYSTV